jgi:multiple sugar transport system permease protein
MSTQVILRQKAQYTPLQRLWRYLFKPNLEGEPRVLQWFIILVVLGGAVFMAMPLWWNIRTAFLDPSDYNHMPLYWVPPRWTLQNFERALATPNLMLGYMNTVILAAIRTANALIVNVSAAYAFSRLRWKGRDVVFLIYLATMLVPGDTAGIQQFVILRKMGFYDNWLGLGTPFQMNVFNIFLIRQFFLDIPRDIEESARLEGCNEIQTMRYIVLPLAKPVMAVVALGVVQGAWGDFFWPLIMTRREEMRTAAVAITRLGNVPATVTMAATFLLDAPIVIIAVFGQRYIVETFSRSLSVE